MPFMFSVGDKVVCVDDVFDVETASYFSPLPKRGLVYCVREIGIDIVLGTPCVWVCGIVGRWYYIGERERPLRATRFRKIEPREVRQNSEIEDFCLCLSLNLRRDAGSTFTTNSPGQCPPRVRHRPAAPATG